MRDPEADFKEFEPRLKYFWFRIKVYSIFQDLNRQSIKTVFLAYLRRGSSSLNSDSELKNRMAPLLSLTEAS